MAKLDGYKVINEQGSEVSLPVVLPSFRGERMEVTGITRIPDGPSEGRVYARSLDGAYGQEFYPKVFGLRIVPRKDGK
jgi:hypothetical protein